MLFAHIHSHTLRISSFDYAKQRPLSTQHTRTGRGTHTHTVTLRHSSERLKAHKQTARRRRDVGSIGTCVWCVCMYVCMLACNSACVQVCVCACLSFASISRLSFSLSLALSHAHFAFCYLASIFLLLLLLLLL